MRLIDADPIYERLKADEELARDRVIDTPSSFPNGAVNPSAIRYMAQLSERTRFKEMVFDAPTIEDRKRGEWTTEQVAELLANMFGEECACSFNGIDEWLPSACKYSETDCPNPKEKHGCWMQFLMQGGADMRGGQDADSDDNHDRL